jgi:Ca-activated chloride channel homolog
MKIVSSRISSRVRNNRRRGSHRRGAMMILVCVMIVAFLTTVAFAVDIAYMHLVKSELRTATDAASKAASEALARTQDVNVAIARGKEIALENLVAGRGLALSDSDFQVGRSQLDVSGKFAFQTTGTPINSIRVTGKRTDSSLSGNVGLFFGRIFGVNNFQPQEVCTSTYIQRDIVLVVDRSGSMNDFNKFNDLKSAIGIFTSILDSSPVDERVGLASYSTTPTEDVDLTTDLTRINSAVARMPVDGFTNISGGIDSGGQIMTRGRSAQFVERTMIVLTDGIQNRGRPARLAAQDEAAKGTVIHAITFGTDADKRSMQEVASIGKGRYFHADNGDELRNVFREIALTLSTIITE